MTSRTAAVVGVGLAGENHLRALTALGISIVGVLASRPERADEAARKWRTRAYQSLAEAVADDATIHVCVPPRWHAEVVDAALAAGRPVICEKPLATSLEEASRLELRSRDAGVNAHIGFNRRFDAGVQSLRSMLTAGELGEPINIWGSYQQQWNAEPSSFDWRFDPQVVGRSRVVADIGAHWLDLAFHVLGSPLARVASIVTRPSAMRDFSLGDGRLERMVPTNEDSFASLVEYRNGTTGSVVGTQLAHGTWDDIQLRIDGSRRSAWWDSRHPNQVSVAQKTEGLRVIDPDSPSRSFEAMMEELYGLASTSIVATFADGVHNAASIDAILDSADVGAWRDVKSAVATAGVP